jgi:hypothetical protein
MTRTLLQKRIFFTENMETSSLAACRKTPRRAVPAAGQQVFTENLLFDRKITGPA